MVCIGENEKDILDDAGEIRLEGAWIGGYKVVDNTNGEVDVYLSRMMKENLQFDLLSAISLHGVFATLFMNSWNGSGEKMEWLSRHGEQRKADYLPGKQFGLLAHRILKNPTRYSG